MGTCSSRSIESFLTFLFQNGFPYTVLANLKLKKWYKCIQASFRVSKSKINNVASDESTLPSAVLSSVVFHSAKKMKY